MDGAQDNPPTRVLVAVDEPGLRRALSISLRARAFDVTAVATGAEVLRTVARDQRMAVLLDLRLPELPALEMVARVRELGGRPLLVLADATHQAEIAAALDAGADDYVTKPFGMDQLLARLRSALRGATPAAVPTDAIAVDLLTGKVGTPRGRPAFSPSQWRLLDLNVRHEGQLLSTDRLMGASGSTDVGELHGDMATLRRALEPDPSRPRYLLSEPRLGYRFDRGISAVSIPGGNRR